MSRLPDTAHACRVRCWRRCASEMGLVLRFLTLIFSYNTSSRYISKSRHFEKSRNCTKTHLFALLDKFAERAVVKDTAIKGQFMSSIEILYFKIESLTGPASGPCSCHTRPCLKNRNGTVAYGRLVPFSNPFPWSVDNCILVVYRIPVQKIQPLGRTLFIRDSPTVYPDQSP